MTRDLEGRVAIVTGAGRGIGRAEALALANAGARVIVNDLGSHWDGTGADQSPADSVVAEICANGGDAIASYGDVSRMETGRDLVQQALDTYGRLDILVNNAGILRPKPFSELSEVDWDLLVNVHLKGHFTVSRAAVEVFIAQASGRIINTSSEAGLGMPLFANYGAAKEGITGLTRTLALELAPHNVTVNQIRPRTGDTRMLPATVEAAETMGAKLSQTLPSATDQGLFTRPEEFGSEWAASLVVFLCTDKASAITGGDFGVGGGQVTVFSQVKPLASIDWRTTESAQKFTAIALGNQGHWSTPP